MFQCNFFPGGFLIESSFNLVCQQYLDVECGRNERYFNRENKTNTNVFVLKDFHFRFDVEKLKIQYFIKWQIFAVNFDSFPVAI